MLLDLATVPAGPQLAVLLADVDRPRLSGVELAEVTRAQRRLANHYLAESLASGLELGLRDAPLGSPQDDDSPPDAATAEAVVRRGEPSEFSAEVLRCVLHLTRNAADGEFWTAWSLHEHFPAVWDAFLSGVLDYRRAKTFTDVLQELSQPQVDVIVSRVLPKAPRLTSWELQRRLQAEAMAIDPAWWARRYKQAVKTRNVRQSANPDGTANLAGHNLPFDEATQAMANINRLAKAAKTAGDHRGLDAIRADIFNGYLTGTYQHATDHQIITDLLHRATTSNDNPTRNHPPSGGPSQGELDFSGETELDRITENDIHPAQRPDPKDPDPAPWGGIPKPRQPIHPQPNPHPARHSPGGPVRARAGYEIRVKLSTLLGLDDHPGEVPGTGPVPAFLARTMVAEQARGHWRYAITDNDGGLLGEGVVRARPVGMAVFAAPVTGAIVEIAAPETLLNELHANPATCGAWVRVVADIAGQHTHNPGRHAHATAHAAPSTNNPLAASRSGGLSDRGEEWRRVARAGLRRHVEIRDRYCLAPGCARPARQADLDHDREFVEGGGTTAENLRALCRRHHRARHEGGWRMSRVPDGSYRWTSPQGLVFQTRPPPIITDLPPPMPR